MRKTDNKISYLKILIMASAVLISGCGVNAMEAVNIAADYTSKANHEDVSFSEKAALSAADFSVGLLRASLDDDNTLLSPLSVLMALGMCANGTAGATREQIEAVLNITAEELNEALYAYNLTLSIEEDEASAVLADSIWLREDFNAEADFLQTCADWYDAEVYAAAFDEQTLKDINTWVSDKTKKRITEIINQMSEGAVAFLINALTFDGEWVKPYEKGQVKDETFTSESGTGQSVELMYDDEWSYLKDDRAEGFLKYYEGNRFAFAALLPEEGYSVDEYIASLTGEHLYGLLKNFERVLVKTAIPKFTVEYGTDLIGALSDLGITDLFDPFLCDLSALSADEGLVVDSVIHRTYISVFEAGTEAAAVTAMQVAETSAFMEEPKTVYLNRPFVYMIVDCEYNIPIFIGVLRTVA